jgi:hypothetical protein
MNLNRFASFDAAPTVLRERHGCFGTDESPYMPVRPRPAPAELSPE